MHGVKRNAAEYLKAFEEILDRNGAMGIAPEFSKKHYPKHEQYMFGVGRVDYNAKDRTCSSFFPKTKHYEEDLWRMEEEYTFSEVEHIFDFVTSQLQSQIDGYSIFGHSAGAQFVHRLLMF